MNRMFNFLENKKPYIIAEVGGNFGGDLKKAKEYINEAAKCGVDAVKFQIYRAETLISDKEPPMPLAGNTYSSQFERFRELELSKKEWEELKSFSNTLGLDFVASAFDENLVDLVANLSPFIKIASGDLTNIPLIRHSLKKDKIIILSTGFASILDIKRVMKEISKERLILMHCISSYPTPIEALNLNVIPFLKKKFNVPIGFSDHSIGILAPLIAIGKGAIIIEKHFTLDKSNRIGDHRLSANPSEMKKIVEKSKEVFKMLGKNIRDGPFEVEKDLMKKMRRSLAAKITIKKGQLITKDNIIALRPEKGIPVWKYDEVLGRKVNKQIPKGDFIKENDILL